MHQGHGTPHGARPQGRGRGAVLAVLVAATVAACGGDKPGQAQASGTGGMPPPEVGVVVATPGDIGLVTELPGRLEASRVAEVRARAAGILQRRLFKEGSDVKAGQPLFAIDASPYQATYQSAQAQVLRAQAAVTRTTEVAKRYEPLVAANAISKQDYADAVAARAQADADLAVAKAAVQTAKISLDYASVTAPISGRIGRALVTEGALVGQGEATPLALVQQINPLYVNFTQSASEVLRLRRAMESGTLKRAGGEAASVRVLLQDGTPYALPGKLLFSDLTVDATTGQITLRAEVPNPKGDLLPGLYVRVQLEQAQASNAIAVPQQAVTRTESGDTLTVVGEGGKLEKRQVKITAGQNNRWIVTEGLKTGEQVMVDGFQKLMMLAPGSPVKPVPWQAAAAGTPGAKP